MQHTEKITISLPYKENVYGSVKRLKWILSVISKNDTILELGCGTGFMITIPLIKMGYKAIGVDTDAASIQYGREILRAEGFDPACLICGTIADVAGSPTVIIASEVFEHIPSEEYDQLFEIIHSKLGSCGKLIITIPNGYGCFEIEAFLWYKLKLGAVLATLGITWCVETIKRSVFKIDYNMIYPHPSTLSGSPHVQRFSARSIKKLLARQKFSVENFDGSTLLAGPFSNLLFTGFEFAMALNNRLGTYFKSAAAGFFLFCKPHKNH